MEQRASIITIATDNLETLKKFYVEKFNWKIEFQTKEIAFFKLNGFLLGLYGRNDLANFVGVKAEGSIFKPYLFAYMLDSETELEHLYQELLAKGVKIIKHPQTPSFGGSYFLVSDIEGNIWEMAYNPYITLDPIGNVTAHLKVNKL